MQEITIKLRESDYKRLTKMAQHTGKSIQTLFYEWVSQLPEFEDTINITQNPVFQMEGYDSDIPKKVKYSKKQGQYLAFINYYTKLHGRAPSEADMQRYFKTTPPSVHQMILKLENLGFISRFPKQPRSIKILLHREELPELE